MTIGPKVEEQERSRRSVRGERIVHRRRPTKSSPKWCSAKFRPRESFNLKKKRGQRKRRDGTYGSQFFQTIPSLPPGHNCLYIGGKRATQESQFSEKCCEAWKCVCKCRIRLIERPGDDFVMFRGSKDGSLEHKCITCHLCHERREKRRLKEAAAEERERKREMEEIAEDRKRRAASVRRIKNIVLPEIPKIPIITENTSYEELDIYVQAFEQVEKLYNNDYNQDADCESTSNESIGNEEFDNFDGLFGEDIINYEDTFCDDLPSPSELSTIY